MRVRDRNTHPHARTRPQMPTDMPATKLAHTNSSGRVRTRVHTHTHTQTHTHAHTRTQSPSFTQPHTQTDTNVPQSHATLPPPGLWGWVVGVRLVLVPL